MALEKSEWAYNDGEPFELRLWFQDEDGDQVRFDIDPDGDLWVIVGSSIIRLRRPDVEILLEKMHEAFATDVIT